MRYFVILIFVMIFFACNKSNYYPKINPNTTYIAYNIHVPDTTKDDWEILTMDFEGNKKSNITNHPDVAWTYTAYRDKLYFISDRDSAYRHYYLYVSDYKGRNVKKVSNLRLEDSWMCTRNNGKEMIVSGRENGNRFQLYLINTKDGKYQQITRDTAAMYRDPCFSPDGTQIVCSYKPKRRDKTRHEELYIMDEYGNNLRQLTHYPEDNISAEGFGYKAGSARWHPTANFISYISQQDGKNSIFAITPDGSKQWKLIDNPDSEGWHDWSSDGKWLVYNGSDINETQYDIFLMNWLTKQKKQLTDNTYRSQLSPVFVEVRD